MKINEFYNEHCFYTMKKMIENNVKVDGIITSPFYATTRKRKNQNTEHYLNNHLGRYDVFIDNMTNEEYIKFTLKLFNGYDKILKENGCVLYNMSYSSENTYLIWLVIAEIIKNTNFIVVDDIIWKKKSALPNNTSSNKLTRIVEHIFVICRKDEIKTFNCNKQVTSTRESGQKMYENIYNFIEAKNNDGSNNLNKATYSTELIEKLLQIYFKKGDLIYDSFMGTGTTANACVKYGCNYIGSEISENQCEFAKKRIEDTLKLECKF